MQEDETDYLRWKLLFVTVVLVGLAILISAQGT